MDDDRLFRRKKKRKKRNTKKSNETRSNHSPPHPDILRGRDEGPNQLHPAHPAIEGIRWRRTLARPAVWSCRCRLTNWSCAISAVVLLFPPSILLESAVAHFLGSLPFALDRWLPRGRCLCCVRYSYIFFCSVWCVCTFR